MLEEKEVLDTLNTVFDGNYVSAGLSGDKLVAQNTDGEDLSMFISEARKQGLL